MPSPVYSGDTTWRIQGGSVTGVTDEGLVFIDLPYRGSMLQASAFRQAWQQGDACPEPGLDLLKLVQAPEITDHGADGTATLRFEGPDGSGEFGESEDLLTEFVERRDVELNDTDFNKKATYAYDAPVIVYTYTVGARRSEPKNSPSLDDPELLRCTQWEDQQQHKNAAGMNAKKGTMWLVIPVKGFSERTRNPSGTWTHQEFHTKLIEAPEIL